MPAGRGRKGGRQPRGRRGKQTTSMVVPRNPMPSPSIGANECENYLDVPQLHEFFPHRASQVLPLIKRSWVHCTQLCIIHRAFLSMEDVFIIHTRQHFKLTHHKLVSKRHPLIGPWLFHQDHWQQQECGTLDCRHILITSWPCRKMWKNAMVAVTIFPKNFRPSGGAHSTDFANTYHHPSPVHIMKKNPCFWRLCTYRPHQLPLPWRRLGGNAESLWTDCEYRLIRNNSPSIDFFYLPFRYSSLCPQKTL